MRVTFDMYPYRKSSTILAVLLLPAELQAGGPEQTVAALRDSGQRAALLADENFADESLRNLYLSSLPAEYGQFAGLSVAEAAAANSCPAGEWALDLLVSTGLKAGAHLDRPTLAESHLTWLAANDLHCAGSDGIYQGQHPHPRGYGAFARLAGLYLADGSGPGYQRLARHLAANAAEVYGLDKRGRLAPGMAADICVIGPHGITDNATYGKPRMLATGVSLVIVNGAIAWRDAAHNAGSFPGQLVTN